MRVIRIVIDVFQVRDPEGAYSVNVWEQYRTGAKRQICHFVLGDHLEEDDLDLPLQVTDDALRAMVRRTIGTAARLPF